MRRLSKPRLTPQQIETRLSKLGLTAEQGETFACPRCQDTKLVCYTEHPAGHPAPVLYSRPCLCKSGRALADAWERGSSSSTSSGSSASSRERSEFLDPFRTLCLQFGRTPTRELVEAYWQELQYFTPEQIARGFRHASRTCRYFPKLADILDGIHGPPI